VSKGRQTLDGVTVRRVQVMLDDATIDRAKALGGGNLSRGIRAALKEDKMDRHQIEAICQMAEATHDYNRGVLWALRHYLKPACGHCKGRGMLGLDRDQAGKAERVRPCDKCGGSGKAPLPVKYHREIREVLHVMEERRSAVGRRVRRKMRVRAEVD
jgi:post-segregation antitoxin (ccd killing protein)